MAYRWSFNASNIRVRGSVIINIDIDVQAQLPLAHPALIIVMLYLHWTPNRLATVRERINTNTGIVGAFIIRSEATMPVAFRYRCYISSYSRIKSTNERAAMYFRYIYSQYSRWILYLQCSTLRLKHIYYSESVRISAIFKTYIFKKGFFIMKILFVFCVSSK